MSSPFYLALNYFANYTREEKESSAIIPAPGQNLSQTSNLQFQVSFRLKRHCIEFKYYADGIHSGLTPPG